MIWGENLTVFFWKHPNYGFRILIKPTRDGSGTPTPVGWPTLALRWAIWSSGASVVPSCCCCFSFWDLKQAAGFPRKKHGFCWKETPETPVFVDSRDLIFVVGIGPIKGTLVMMCYRGHDNVHLRGQAYQSVCFFSRWICPTVWLKSLRIHQSSMLELLVQVPDFHPFPSSCDS